MNIYISHLHRDTTPADIHVLFAGFGTIVISKITYVLELQTRLPVGFVYVDVEDNLMAERAIEKLNGSMVNGNAITVKKAL